MRCLAPASPHHAATSPLAQKGGKTNNIMKYIAIIALAVTALSLSACAHKDTGSSSTTSSTSSTGYHK